MLIFPKGIRLASSEDLLGLPDYFEMLNQVKMAKIEPGYTLFLSDDGIFKNYAEININSQDAWKLFCSLCERLLPTEVQPIIGSIDDNDDDLFKGSYSNTIKLLSRLDKFKFYLVNDCHMQFGFSSVLSEDVFEVFMTTTKHFMVWTDKIDILEDIMREYSLAQTNDLQFIDEFPRTIINLEYGEDFYEYQDLIDHLIKLIR
jgi:hypothetical protein